MCNQMEIQRDEWGRSLRDQRDRGSKSSICSKLVVVFPSGHVKSPDRMSKSFILVISSIEY
jgi:hypothetical protein